MSRLIDADALFREMEKAQWYNNADRDEIAEELVLNAPTIEPERNKGRWERLMMYLADLQLTYSPNWGANGCGDEKLYEFVTGLIEELEGWEDGGGA